MNYEQDSMTQVIGETRSLCPVCLQVIPARKVSENHNVYMEKTCPEHGDFRTLIWRADGDTYLEWGTWGTDYTNPQDAFQQPSNGCPYDCGLCSNHKAETCIAVVEVTDGCNLRCPICFAGVDGVTYEPDIATLRNMFEQLLANAGPNCPIQLSGGEPTIRDDLPQIAGVARDLGVNFIVTNTNGVRIANDIEYLRQLHDNGVDTIFLQFDGVTDAVYRYTRGEDLFEMKLRALENCSRVGIGVILAVTLVPRINDSQIGDIIQFAKRWIPTTKGIHFQPVSYFGRYPGPPGDEDRMTIPDLLTAIEEQTDGEVRKENFIPRERREPFCSFSGLFVLDTANKLASVTGINQAQKAETTSCCCKEAPAQRLRKSLPKVWKLTPLGCGPQPEYSPGSLASLFQRAETHSFAISSMPFQDVWNVDLNRLENCCIHILNPGSRLIPLCARYLTSIDGSTLYTRRKEDGYVSSILDKQQDPAACIQGTFRTNRY